MSPTQTEREHHRTDAETHEAYENEDYPMPHRYAEAPGSDREISLGTGTILAIFFALALVCSVFFGFGYTIGHKSPGPSALAPSTASTRSLSDAFKSFKPAPGGAADAASSTPTDHEDFASTTSPAKVVVPSTAAAANITKSSVPAAPVTKKPFDPDAEIVTTTSPAPIVKSAAITHPTPAVQTAPADMAPVTSPSVASPSGTAIVQVAAVSHQEDADTLIGALKHKGYTVAVRHESQDKLLHIQLGPYATKKDAEAMRQRLQGDGYNAILK